VLSETLPSGQVSETEDNRSIRISIGTLHGFDEREITIVQTVRVDYCNLQLNPDSIGDSVPPGFGYASQVTNLWETEEPEIENKALELTENQSNLYYKAKQIFDFVMEYLQYQTSSNVYSALWTYQNQKGDCAEHANLFIALCRAAGIPAKFVSCYGYKPELEPNLDQMGHAFVTVYLPDAGWIPADLTWPLDIGQFSELDFNHIVSATSDGDDMFGFGGNIISPDVARITSIGGNPSIELESSTITREITAEVILNAESQMQNHTQKFFVTVKNVGGQAIENIEVELQADEDYFEVPQAQIISRLEPGHNQQVIFDVEVKADVENSLLKASATYDSQYGTFLAEDQMSVSATLSAPPEEAINTLLLALIAVIIGLLIAVAAVLMRR